MSPTASPAVPVPDAVESTDYAVAALSGGTAFLAIFGFLIAAFLLRTKRVEDQEKADEACAGVPISGLRASDFTTTVYPTAGRTGSQPRRLTYAEEDSMLGSQDADDIYTMAAKPEKFSIITDRLDMAEDPEADAIDAIYEAHLNEGGGGDAIYGRDDDLLGDAGIYGLSSGATPTADTFPRESDTSDDDDATLVDTLPSESDNSDVDDVPPLRFHGARPTKAHEEYSSAMKRFFSDGSGGSGDDMVYEGVADLRARHSIKAQPPSPKQPIFEPTQAMVDTDASSLRLKSVHRSNPVFDLQVAESTPSVDSALQNVSEEDDHDGDDGMEWENVLALLTANASTDGSKNTPVREPSLRPATQWEPHAPEAPVEATYELADDLQTGTPARRPSLIPTPNGEMRAQDVSDDATYQLATSLQQQQKPSTATPVTRTFPEQGSTQKPRASSKGNGRRWNKQMKRMKSLVPADADATGGLEVVSVRLHKGAEDVQPGGSDSDDIETFLTAVAADTADTTDNTPPAPQDNSSDSTALQDSSTPAGTVRKERRRSSLV